MHYFKLDTPVGCVTDGSPNAPLKIYGALRCRDNTPYNATTTPLEELKPMLAILVCTRYLRVGEGLGRCFIEFTFL